MTRSEIDVEVVNQPKEYLFGMIRTFAVVKVTLKETAQMSLEPEIVPGAGLVGVENGKLVYTPPRDGGAPPRFYLIIQLLFTIMVSRQKMLSH